MEEIHGINDMKNMKISISRSIIFLCVVIGVLIVYYKTLKASEKTSKGLKLLKFIFFLLIMLSGLKALYNANTVDKKLSIIIFLSLILNFLNLRYNIKKCDYPGLFKVKLIFISSFIIIITALLFRYSFNNDIYSFLYIEDKLGEGDWLNNLLGTVNIESEYDRDLSYCPDMSKEDYKKEKTDDYGKWNALTNEEQNNCLTMIITKNERKDIDDDVYA